MAVSKRGGLGKGLGALLGEANTQSPEVEEIRQIPLDMIVANPDQPRRMFAEESLSELAASIREHGVIQPILVQETPDGKFQLIAGERRTRASRLAGTNTIPAIIRKVEPQDRLEIALIENIQREDINSIDQALAYRQLIDRFSLTQEQVAQRVGKSRASVANSLRLLGLPMVVLQMIRDGDITEGHGRALLMAPEPKRIDLAELALKKGLNVRELERAAREASERNEPKAGLDVSRETHRLPDPHLQAVADRLREALATRVTIRDEGDDTGVIMIHYYDLDDLERLIAQVCSHSANL